MTMVALPSELIERRMMYHTSYVTPESGHMSSSSRSKLDGSSAVKHRQLQPSHREEDSDMKKLADGSSRRQQAKKTKTPWTPEEDAMLEKLIAEHGPKQWPVVASLLAHRTSKQARERWCNHLAPGLKRGPWTPEEEQLLLELHAEWGNQWCEITKRIEGRTANGIKNHWNCATTRRRLNLPSKSPRSAAKDDDGRTPRPKSIEVAPSQNSKRKRTAQSDEEPNSSPERSASEGRFSNGTRPSLGAAVSEHAVVAHVTRTGRTVRRTEAARWNDRQNQQRRQRTSAASAAADAKRCTVAAFKPKAKANAPNNAKAREPAVPSQKEKENSWPEYVSDTLLLSSMKDKELERISLDSSAFSYDFADAHGNEWNDHYESAMGLGADAPSSEDSDRHTEGLKATFMHSSNIAGMSVASLESVDWTDLTETPESSMDCGSASELPLQVGHTTKANETLDPETAAVPIMRQTQQQLQWRSEKQSDQSPLSMPAPLVLPTSDDRPLGFDLVMESLPVTTTGRDSSMGFSPFDDDMQSSISGVTTPESFLM